MKDISDRVVVILPLSRRCTRVDGRPLYATRVRDLGLTAYASNPHDADVRVKQMFAAWAAVHRTSHTLEEALAHSKLEWHYQSEYSGSHCYELILEGGTVETVWPKSAGPEPWVDEDLAAAAY